MSTHPTEANYKRLAVVLVGCLIASIVVTFAILLFGLNKSADTSAATSVRRGRVLDQQTKVLNHVNECLTINTACYNSNLRRTSGILSAVFEQDIAIASCADEPGQQTEREIRKCAQRVVAASREARTPHR